MGRVNWWVFGTGIPGALFLFLGAGWLATVGAIFLLWSHNCEMAHTRRSTGRQA